MDHAEQTRDALAAAGEQPTVGLLLRQERLKQSITLETVADELKLTVQKIKALETGDYALLNGRTFVRGHLRSYAKLLGLPEHKVLQQYDDQAGEVVQRPSTPRKPLTSPKPSWPVAGIVKLVSMVLGAVLILAAAWLWMQQPTSSSDTSVQSSAEPALEETAAQTPARAPVGAGSTAQIGAEMSADRVVVDNVAAATVDTQVAPGVVASVAAPAVAAPTPAAPRQVLQNQTSQAASEPRQAATDVGPLLKMSLSGDCWIQVKDASGKLLLSALRRSGDRVELRGKAPLDVLLGYAPAVKVEYDGAPIAVEYNERNYSARLRLQPTTKVE